MRKIQWLKSKFDVAFLCIYDVIRLHQVSGSKNYDDAMTEQVPGVSWANFVGRHKPSVPNGDERLDSDLQLWSRRGP